MRARLQSPAETHLLPVKALPGYVNHSEHNDPLLPPPAPGVTPPGQWPPCRPRCPPDPDQSGPPPAPATYLPSTTAPLHPSMSLLSCPTGRWFSTSSMFPASLHVTLLLCSNYFSPCLHFSRSPPLPSPVLGSVPGPWREGPDPSPSQGSG